MGSGEIWTREVMVVNPIPNPLPYRSPHIISDKCQNHYNLLRWRRYPKITNLWDRYASGPNDHPRSRDEGWNRVQTTMKPTPTWGQSLMAEDLRRTATFVEAQNLIWLSKKRNPTYANSCFYVCPAVVHTFTKSEAITTTSPLQNFTLRANCTLDEKRIFL
jgi:hypothetical protein